MSLHSISILVVIIPLLISLAITVGTGIFTARRSLVVGARSFGAAIFIEAAWTQAFLIELLDPTLQGKIFWDDIQWIAALVVPLALLSFSLEYSGIKLARPRLTWAALSVIPLLGVVMIFADPFPGMVTRAVQLLPGSPFSTYSYEYGPLLWVGIAYTYGIIFSTLTLLVRLAIRQHGLYRMQTFIILLGIFTPVMGTLLGTLNVRLAAGRDVSPYVFAIGNLVICMGLFRYRIFDILPLARDAVVENMEDGVIVLDSQGRLLDINPAARLMIGEPTSLLVGQPVTSGLPKWLFDMQLNLNQKSVRQEHTFQLGQETRTVDLQITRLSSPRGAFTGYLIILRDITESKLVETTLENAYATTQQQVAERTVELSRMNRTLSMINECDQALIRMDDEQDLLKAICKIIVETGGYRSAWIGCVESKAGCKGVPTAFHSSGLNTPEFMHSFINEHHADNQTPVDGKRPVHIYDVATDPALEAFREEALAQEILAVITAPLGYGTDLYGDLVIFNAATYEYDEKEAELLNKLINNVCYGVHARRVRVDRDRAEALADKAANDLFEAYESTLEGWSKALELREVETAEHSQRVVDWTLALARRMGVGEEECVHIRRGALLHDIGKMGVPDSILLKPAGLTEEDWRIMRQHPVRARELLMAVHYLEPALIIPYYHHERWDGSGYPLGLMGQAIPRPARIFAVVDAWDALLYDRPYRKGWPMQKVLDYLDKNAGKLFDPEVVQVFLEIMIPTREDLPLALQVEEELLSDSLI